MRVLHEICGILEDELEDITKVGSINRQDLEVVDKSVDIIKDIETIKAMREAYPDDYRTDGYSNRYPYYYEDGMSMARGGGRGGRYARDGRGYTRTSEKEMMEEKIDELKRQLESMK